MVALPILSESVRTEVQYISCLLLMSCLRWLVGVDDLNIPQQTRLINVIWIAIVKRRCGACGGWLHVGRRPGPCAVGILFLCWTAHSDQNMVLGAQLGRLVSDIPVAIPCQVWTAAHSLSSTLSTDDCGGRFFGGPEAVQVRLTPRLARATYRCI